MATQPAASTLQSTIGQALLQEGLVDEGQLQRALRVQSRLEERKQLGDVIIELGYATRKAINAAIAKHGSSMRLGEILVEQGIVTEDTLSMALATQKEQGVRLGEVLIHMGAINQRTLMQTVAHQAGVAYIEPSINMIDTSVLKGVSPDYLAKFNFIPFCRNDDGRVTVIVTDLRDDDALQAIEELYHSNVELSLGPEENIQQCIEDFRQFRHSEDAHAAPGQEDTVVKMVDYILGQAIDEGASDIHIEPLSNVVRVRYRIDGVLVYKTDLPLDMLPKFISRIKILADVNITEHQRHQGGRLLFRHNGKELDMRLSVFVSVHGESAVLRILNKDLALVSLDELGMNTTMLERFREEVLDMPTGVVLITGPTGSGKTTTLYSSLEYCNDVTRKIITAEDPAEFTIEGLVQCSIYEKVGRTFESTLREMVRQDPDIIVMGEIRDKITAEVAIQAALTGHKVYSTFHTEDTIGGLLRLIDMQIETFLISSTVISVLAQRLLRRICPQCAKPYVPTAKEVNAAGLKMNEVREYEYARGQGCSHCSHTGYRGRVGAYELLVLNEPVKQAIIEKKTAHEIREISMESTGLVSMREDAVSKVIRGVTTFEEVLKHTPQTFAMRPLHQIRTLCQ